MFGSLFFCFFLSLFFGESLFSSLNSLCCGFFCGFDIRGNFGNRLCFFLRLFSRRGSIIIDGLCGFQRNFADIKQCFRNNFFRYLFDFRFVFNSLLNFGFGGFFCLFSLFGGNCDRFQLLFRFIFNNGFRCFNFGYGL